MVRSRFSAALYLILVFASGILVGIVGNRLYMTTTVAANTIPPAKNNMAQYRAQVHSELKQKVGVTDEQIAKIDAIMEDTRRKYDALHAQEKPLRDKIDKDRVESIRAVLDDKQRTAYDQWRADRAKAAAAKNKK